MQSAPTSSRGSWAIDELYARYHGTEWGVPLHDDRRLFEFLILEGAQAGLSWHTVLKKRENYRAAFDQFNPEEVARYNAAKITKPMNDAGIIRNKLEIHSTVQNAKAFLKVQEKFGSFDAYLWRFVNGRPKINRWKSLKQIPPRTASSDAMSKDVWQRGFNFVGSTICYAHMQVTGMVNDHLVPCFRHRQLR
jgi:DNA-3-methyladenine glycosylase I